MALFSVFFLVAFYFKRVTATPVFISAVIVEIFVITIHTLNQNGVLNISFLWLNAIGALGVILMSVLLQWTKSNRHATNSQNREK